MKKSHWEIAGHTVNFQPFIQSLSKHYTLSSHSLEKINKHFSDFRKSPSIYRFSETLLGDLEIAAKRFALPVTGTKWTGGMICIEGDNYGFYVVPVVDVGVIIPFFYGEPTLTRPEIKVLGSVAVLYLSTGNPDTRKWNPPTAPASQKAKKLKKFEREIQDLSQFPIIQVGIDWKKQRIFHVDGAAVRGHFRLQACGPNWSQRELIWVHPHSRTYKNNWATNEASEMAD